MDSTDELAVANKAGRMLAYVALAMSMTTGAVVGFALGNTWWGVLGGTATGFVVWAGYAFIIGLCAMAAKDMPAADDLGPDARWPRG